MNTHGMCIQYNIVIAYLLISGFFLLIPGQLLTSKHNDSS